VAEAIRTAEHMAATRAQPATAADDFHPSTTLFRAPPAESVAPRQPAVAPQPIAHAHVAERAPVQPVEPVQRSAPAPQPVAQPRMPRVEDFGPMVKAEVEEKAKPRPEHEGGAIGLLRRLTVGLTRREEEPAKLEPAQPREPKLRQPPPEARRLNSQDPQVYAPRRGQLDDQGRLTPQARVTHDDDQLEIPAFLRRQAN
jgi:cell division protein FtsZ